MLFSVVLYLLFVVVKVSGAIKALFHTVLIVFFVFSPTLTRWDQCPAAEECFTGSGPAETNQGQWQCIDRVWKGPRPQERRVQRKHCVHSVVLLLMLMIFCIDNFLCDLAHDLRFSSLIFSPIFTVFNFNFCVAILPSLITVCFVAGAVCACEHVGESWGGTHCTGK